MYSIDWHILHTEHNQCTLLSHIFCTQNTATDILCAQNTASVVSRLTYYAHRTQPTYSLDWYCVHRTQPISSLTYCAHRTQLTYSLHLHTVHTEHSQWTLFTDILCTQNTANVLSSLTYCAHGTQPTYSLHWHTVHTEHSQCTLFTNTSNECILLRDTSSLLSWYSANIQWLTYTHRIQYI